MTNKISGIAILNLIIKNGKLLTVVGITSLILSLAVSFMMPVYYKSTSIVYAYNPEAYDPRNIWDSKNPYGSSADADRIMAIAQSREVQNYITEKYDLMKHYDIDPTHWRAKVDLTNKFQGNLNIVENDLSAIEISFLDENADTAAMIVNDIVAKTDEINKKPLLEFSKKLFESSEKILNERYSGIDSIQKIINVLHFDKNFSRSEVITSELLQTITELNSARKNLDLIKQDFSTMNIIERAEPIAKKAKPQKLVIIITSVIIAEVTAILILLLSALKKNEI
ncbi:hypothetical protein [Cytophaga hutchinsonii]|jgi:capsular polysaccharide biosynthesis protein|uniref:Polysaccharide chain length determinant N-terminal domain-containing protein n=1 Tax=Cytophaga hutchinsonii (strain ATCC 33406 / DSM 1761 / CIP 103989 / NBRC 15051 / NCIMB 9469 / D465) TaxID=269798 RepID=A0A6N4SSN6_CYTH3|nr:hypothetical protein [Cytophaga hutchinsonii]ABG59441.1 conserved hypothetical protein [Cytophaga hutchinsonii ATCC 33406]SFX96225.1 Chain length determinant protein [Cytophaga hutchinsonii ATCC 33406]